MILTTRCNNCNQEIKKWTWYTDRIELAKSEGEFIEQNCKSCDNKTKNHVDDFQATPSKFAHVIASLIFLIGTPIVLYLIWDVLWMLKRSYSILVVAGLVLVPITVYVLILKDDRRKVRSFNNHKMKGHN
jgi:hypothetical protein